MLLGALWTEPPPPGCENQAHCHKFLETFFGWGQLVGRWLGQLVGSTAWVNWLVDCLGQLGGRWLGQLVGRWLGQLVGSTGPGSTGWLGQLAGVNCPLKEVVVPGSIFLWHIPPFPEFRPLL